MKALVGAFNEEKALVGAFSVITNLRMELFEALVPGGGGGGVAPAAAVCAAAGAGRGAGPHTLRPPGPQAEVAVGGVQTLLGCS